MVPEGNTEIKKEMKTNGDDNYTIKSKLIFT